MLVPASFDYIEEMTRGKIKKKFFLIFNQTKNTFIVFIFFSFFKEF